MVGMEQTRLKRKPSSTAAASHPLRLVRARAGTSWRIDPGRFEYRVVATCPWVSLTGLQLRCSAETTSHLGAEVLGLGVGPLVHACATAPKLVAHEAARSTHGRATVCLCVPSEGATCEPCSAVFDSDRPVGEAASSATQQRSKHNIAQVQHLITFTGTDLIKLQML